MFGSWATHVTLKGPSVVKKLIHHWNEQINLRKFYHSGMNEYVYSPAITKFHLD